MLWTLAGDDFDVRVVSPGRDGFEVDSSDLRALVRLLLRRARNRSGQSLAEIAERMGASSRNAWARYEQGAALPSMEKLLELWHVARPEYDLVLDEASE